MCRSHAILAFNTGAAKFNGRYYMAFRHDKYLAIAGIYAHSDESVQAAVDENTAEAYDRKSIPSLMVIRLA